MAIETPDFVTLKEVNDNSRVEQETWIDRKFPARITSREITVKFHFPIEQSHVIKHFARGSEPFQYTRDGVSFQWIARILGSEWIPHPDYPDDFHRRFLVGTIDALLLPVPDMSLDTVNIPQVVGAS